MTIPEGIAKAVVCLAILTFATVSHAQPLPMGVPDLCAGGVIIPAGASARYIGRVTERCIGVHGTLTIANNTTLTVETLLVYPDGQLLIGSPTVPATGVEIIIRDSQIDTAVDPEQYGHGVVCFGVCKFYGAPKTPTFARLLTAPAAGATTLEVSGPVSWQPGDRLILPESRQRVDPNWANQAAFQPEWETPIVKAIKGFTLTLAAPLKYSHPGVTGSEQSFLPHVGNLTRSITIRSANPDGVRGHVIALHRADVDFRYVAFVDLGRTTIAPLDSTDGAHIGTNQIGRYPLHLHHLIGPETPTSGRQFQLIGNAVDGSPKWGIAVHNTSFGNVHDNVVYNANGAAFMFEDGQESHNEVVHNFAVRSVGTGGRMGGGREGGGFYFRGPLNRVRDNVAANIFSDGPDSAYGYKFFFTYLGQLRVPLKPGTDTTLPGMYTEVNGNATPIAEFQNNQVYASESGLTFWWVGTFGITPNLSTPRSVFEGLTAWHLFGRGIFQYESFNVTVKDFIALNTGFNYGVGLTGGDYLAQDFRLEHPQVEGFDVGLDPSFVTGGTPLTIVGGRLQNRINVRVPMLVTSNARADQMDPTDLVIDGTTFEARPGQPLTAIEMAYGATPTRNLIQRHTVTVRQYQGVAGQTFQVYYREQASDFLVPPTIRNADGYPSVLGAPVAGLTNAQAWTQHGLAIAGAVSPCSTTRPEIVGLVCGATALPPPVVVVPPVVIVPPVVVVPPVKPLPPLVLCSTVVRLRNWIVWDQGGRLGPAPCRLQ